jgi:hypothetical protein
MLRVFLLISVAAITAGCASEVIRSPASLLPPSSTDRARIEISEEASIEPSTGYRRVLPSGSLWELRGTLPQGAAYRRVNGIFTVEGAHVHEAYIKLNGAVVGKAEPNGIFFVDRDPGNMEVITGSEVEKRLSFTVSAGETRYVRSSVGLGVLVYRIIPELVAEEEAKKEIADLAYTGSNGMRK